MKKKRSIGSKIGNFLYVDKCLIWNDKINENNTSSLCDIFREYFANNKFIVLLNKIIFQHM